MDKSASEYNSHINVVTNRRVPQNKFLEQLSNYQRFKADLHLEVSYLCEIGRGGWKKDVSLVIFFCVSFDMKKSLNLFQYKSRQS
jgi:hypothetical protein